MKTKLKTLTAVAVLGAIMYTGPVLAADYVIDTKGAHASVNFKIKHLGYSWLTGRFDKFGGSFSFDKENPNASKISVEIDTNSINSNHAQRDKHLRSKDFLDVAKFPKAMFVSTSIEAKAGDTAVVNGKLTLHGVTKDIAINAEYVGGGKDPWGGFRQGFSGSTRITLADYGINFNLGPKSKELELTLHIEGIRQ